MVKYVKQNGPVTPHTGVWIETASVLAIDKLIGVTPHTGVWIETH